jgi:hypothetical protein
MAALTDPETGSDGVFSVNLLFVSTDGGLFLGRGRSHGRPYRPRDR